ncbi:MAG: UrcA family protein [Porphyrobacter sp.]|nr:UrcA family protein [Porphyrobacter sp.]
MRIKTTLLAAAIAAATLGTLAAVPATAAPARAEAPPSISVAYGDLDLTTPEGEAELTRRVRKAALRVCRFRADGSVNDATAEQACYRQARVRAGVEIAQIISNRRYGG